MEGRRLLGYIILLLVLIFLHEFGHWFVYNFVFYPELYHYGLGAWFGVSPAGFYVNYWCIHPGVEIWVTLGGLLFVSPFLLLWRKGDFVERGIVLGLVLYGLLEVLLR